MQGAIALYSLGLHGLVNCLALPIFTPANPARCRLYGRRLQRNLCRGKGCEGDDCDPASDTCSGDHCVDIGCDGTDCDHDNDTCESGYRTGHLCSADTSQARGRIAPAIPVLDQSATLAYALGRIASRGTIPVADARAMAAL